MISKTVPTRAWQVQGEKFEFDARYKVTEYLGAGAYGVVCAAEDLQTLETVAIKKCKKIFQSRTLAKRTLRELRLLRLLRHDNVIQIKTIIQPHDPNAFSEMYIVFEIMETDLAQIIRSSQPLKDQHIQYFMHQIMLALEYLHGLCILHRDLKPRNILINSNCRLKIADFGLARLYNKSNCSKIVAMTDYVTTRWYRAPEVLVGWSQYTAAVDMWAAGCIMGELIGRNPLFPGCDSWKQLDLICTCIGKPDEDFIASARKPGYKQYLRDLPQDMRKSDFKALFPAANPNAVSLLRRLLQMAPSQRCDASSSLKSSYLRPFASLEAMNSALPPLPHGLSHVEALNEEFSFEDEKLTIEELRHQLLHEVHQYNKLPRDEDEVATSAHVAAGVAIDGACINESGPLSRQQASSQPPSPPDRQDVKSRQRALSKSYGFDPDPGGQADLKRNRPLLGEVNDTKVEEVTDMMELLRFPVSRVAATATPLRDGQHRSIAAKEGGAGHNHRDLKQASAPAGRMFTTCFTDENPPDFCMIGAGFWGKKDGTDGMHLTSQKNTVAAQDPPVEPAMRNPPMSIYGLASAFCRWE